MAKLGFQFTNLCGIVYKGGPLIFTSNGELISPVGNRVTVFNLKEQTARTMPFWNPYPIVAMDLHPRGDLLVMMDEEGHCGIANYYRKTLLTTKKFGRNVSTCIVKFNPSGSHFLVVQDRRVEVWRTPGREKEFNPFVKDHSMLYAEEVRTVAWSPCGRLVVAGLANGQLVVRPVRYIGGYKDKFLIRHTNPVIGVYWDGSDMISVDEGGYIFWWRWGKEDKKGPGKMKAARSPRSGGAEGPGGRDLTKGIWTAEAVTAQRPDSKWRRVTSVAYFAPTRRILIGYETGEFVMFSGPPELKWLSKMEVSTGKHDISSCVFSADGAWVAFGQSDIGQLCVWHLEEESFLLRQQGHLNNLRCLAYSPDGQLIATGGEDGKVKVWNVQSGFCFVTFSHHTAPVTGIVFSRKGKSLFTSSFDGTVRGFDLVRYRNFRILQGPEPRQFTSVTLDSSGEVVAAGTMDFDVVVWSVQTGVVLDVLSGHEAPVSSVAFEPTEGGGTLASSSWDHTVRLWDVYSRKAGAQVLTHGTDVLCVAWRGDGKELAASCMGGSLSFWSPQEAEQVGFIEAGKDLRIRGKSLHSKRATRTDPDSRSMMCLCYSPGGQDILCGGRSRSLCVYNVEQRLLLKRYALSFNKALDGVSEPQRRRQKDGLFQEVSAYGGEDVGMELPGVQGGLHANPELSSAFQAHAVAFAPTGRSWAVVTSEGLLVWSRDEALIFDPFELEAEITRDSTAAALGRGAYLQALVMALRLNEEDMLKHVFYRIPHLEVQGVVCDLPPHHMSRLLAFLAKHTSSSPQLELNLIWCLHIAQQHSQYLQDRSLAFLPTFRDIRKAVGEHYRDLSAVCDGNKYSLSFLIAQGRARHNIPAPVLEEAKKTEEEEEEEQYAALMSQIATASAIPAKKRKKGGLTRTPSSSKGERDSGADRLAFFLG